MKTEKIADRIEDGNNLADFLANYLNFRFKYEFKKVSLEQDKRDMIDYACEKTQKTAQFKCRENKNDLIYEALRFYRNGDSFEEIDGRDVRSIAKWYVCLSGDKKRVVVAETSAIKKMVNKEISKLEIDSFSLAKYEKQANQSDNKTLKLNGGKNSIQSWFKIDEGIDTKPYSKILVFIPFESIFDSITIDVRDGEVITDKSTWKN